MTGAYGGSVLRPDMTAPADAPVARQRRDVVFTFSWVTWDGAQRRGMHFAQDRLAQTLLRDDRIGGLVVADWFRSAPVKLARTVVLRDDQPFPDRPGAARCHPLRLRRSDPVGLPAIERSMRRYDHCLRRSVRRAGLERPVVITMHPLIAGFAPLEWADRVVFYASDDWSASPEYRAWWPAFDEAYRRIRVTGRAVCAVSQPIVDRIQPRGPSIVVPNGIEPAEWQSIAAAPAWLRALPSPRILYVGTLDARLDITAVTQVARAFEGGSVVLVGPDKDPEHLERLRRIDNVLVHGAVARSGVPALMHGADVCIVPHRRTAFTRAMSPLKVYEYLAAGRPVAAVDLPPIQGVDDRVVLSREGDDFAAAVVQALELGPAAEPARRRFLEAHAWHCRHERILEFALGPASLDGP